MENDFKIGDVVRCKPGFDSSCQSGQLAHNGGGGYKEGKVFEIERFSTSNVNKIIAWPTDGGSGIYIQALEYATPKEILLSTVL